MTNSTLKNTKIKSTIKFCSFIIFTAYTCTYLEVLLNDLHPGTDVEINNGLTLNLIFPLSLSVVCLKHIPIFPRVPVANTVRHCHGAPACTHRGASEQFKGPNEKIVKRRQMTVRPGRVSLSSSRWSRGPLMG